MQANPLSQMRVVSRSAEGSAGKKNQISLHSTHAGTSQRVQRGTKRPVGVSEQTRKIVAKWRVSKTMTGKCHAGWLSSRVEMLSIVPNMRSIRATRSASQSLGLRQASKPLIVQASSIEARVSTRVKVT